MESELEQREGNYTPSRNIIIFIILKVLSDGKGEGVWVVSIDRIPWVGYEQREAKLSIPVKAESDLWSSGT